MNIGIYAFAKIKTAEAPRKLAGYLLCDSPMLGMAAPTGFPGFV